MVDRLYEKIGGRKTISTLVRVFYDKVQADARLGRFFKQTDMENLRARQAMFLTMLFGGSQTFTGIDLKAAHAGARQQGMNDADFDYLLGHFREALQEIGVAPDFTTEIMARLEGTRNPVMGR
jgi:truncated hemoglobin YjbI